MCLIGVWMHKHEELLRQLDELFKQKPRNNAAIEMLHAQYIHEWHKFEESVCMQCGIPRHELMLKRWNHG